MGTAVFESIRQDLREATLAAHADEMVPFGRTTAAELFERAERFAEDLAEHADDVTMFANERGFATLFATVERVRRALEAISANAFNAADERGVYHSDGHRSTQAFLQASVNVSNRERVEHRMIAELVKLCPHVGVLLADGTLPVGHAIALGRLVANDRIARDELSAAMSGFLLTANLTPHDVFAKRVRSWGRLHDQDGSPPDAEASHRNRDVRLSNVLDAFVLEGRFGNIQGAKLEAILQCFVDIEFDRDWQEARAIYGDATCVKHLRRNPGQRRADAFEAIFLAAIGQGTAKDVEIIINIVTDAHTFEDAARQATHAAEAAAEAATDTAGDTTDEDEAVGSDETESAPVDDDTADDTVDDDTTVDDTASGDESARDDDPADVQSSAPAAPSSARRRFCHTLDGVDINPLAAVQAALDGHFRALLVGDDGVIINQGRKQRFFRGNTRVAAQLQAGLDNLTDESLPRPSACRPGMPGLSTTHRPRHRMGL